MHLLNPFTHHSLPLPSLLSLPALLGFNHPPSFSTLINAFISPLSTLLHGLPPEFVLDPTYAPYSTISWDNLRRLFISKAVSFDRTVAVMIYGFNRQSLAFAHISEAGGVVAWIPVDSNKRYYDVIRRLDDGLVWAVTEVGEVEAWDIESEQKPVLVKCVGCLLEAEPPSEEDVPSECDLLEKRYIVEIEGELLQVLRVVICRPCITQDYETEIMLNETERFEVYKLGADEEEWVRMEGGVGEDWVLFLGDNESVAVKAEDVPGEGKGNRIYFSDDDHLRARYGGLDMGVCDLDDGSIEVWSDERKENSPFPVWVFSGTNV
ncbi:hypothetical protein QJS04_geneDACA023081 [Acorus gramineus]|uniref:KIB1-4 beta-propeller domain-containing protein n=1 Tax=Acorus gramineus TaxID=55184 RepID=A0AAV9BK07_ACOGR|nr:hypothetical protein QJS04_geneDACA023081 [Acorus gramineus]